MRKLVVEYLSRNNDVKIVGEASDGEEAFAKIEECQPDIVLSDMSLPGMSGVEIARKIKSIMPNVHVYIFSAYEVNEFRELELDSPADGFIQKSYLKSELMDMIQKELEIKKNSKV
jgi:DNA-binding NarL/FixJ family response regulator